jgi:AraC-like DNA-binding protein
MDHQTLWAFADECQVVAGRVEQNPASSADLIRDLLARTPCAADARTQLIVDGLAARMLERALECARTAGVGSAPFKVADLLGHLEQRFADPALCLSRAARHAALSPGHLARLLKASTGLTFLQHLRRLRVQHADRLLLTTMFSIKEIAAQCGYGATGSFNRDFQRVHGCAPRMWRAQHRIPLAMPARITDWRAIARTERC